MKRKWVFTGAAWCLGALFLGSVLAVGGTTEWYGLEALAKGKEPLWQYTYRSSWDPAQTAVEGLAVSWGSGPVEIRLGEGPLVQVTEYAAQPLNEDQQLSLSSSGGTLKVRWDGSRLPLGMFRPVEKRLVVEIPRETAAQLDELTCNNLSGDIQVQGFSAEKVEVGSLSGDLTLSSLSGEKVRVSTVSGDIQWSQGQADSLFLETTSGQVEVSKVQAETCSLQTVTGPVEFQGGSGDLAVETVSGPVQARLSACPQEADLRSVSGALTLTLPENGGFEAVYSSVSGSFHSQFPGQEGGQPGGSLVYAKGGPKLQFTTTSGRMEIDRM